MNETIKLTAAMKDLAARKIPYDAEALIELVSNGHVKLDRGGDVIYDEHCDYHLPGVNAVLPPPGPGASALDRARFLRALRHDMRGVDLSPYDATSQEAATAVQKAVTAERQAEAATVLPPQPGVGASKAERTAYQAALAQLIAEEI